MSSIGAIAIAIVAGAGFVRHRRVECAYTSHGLPALGPRCLQDMRLRVCLFLCWMPLIPSLALSMDAAGDAGVSADDARTIATRYFATEYCIEGGIGMPTAHGDHWEFPVRVGAAGRVMPEPLRVHRRTGKASWAGPDAARCSERNKPGPAR